MIHERKTGKYIALGFSLLILSTVPYFVFKHDPAIYTILIIAIATLGIGTMVAAGFIEEDSYKIIKKEVLLFDQNYLKELKNRYSNIKRKYTAVTILGVSFVAIGGISLLLVENNIVLREMLVPYYPVFIICISIGVYILTITLSIIEAYKRLADNESFINRLGFKLVRRARKKVDDL